MWKTGVAAEPGCTEEGSQRKRGWKDELDQVRAGVQAEGRSHMGYSPSGFRQLRLENAESVE